jgi:hypothetical protein
MSEPFVSYRSEFYPEITIFVIFDEYEEYDNIKNLFDDLGYAFVAPEHNIIFIDGENLVENLDIDTLKFIEAHEISHIILNHKGPYSEIEEIEADMGAKYLLDKFNYPNSIEILISQFENRHGKPFDEYEYDDFLEKNKIPFGNQ